VGGLADTVVDADAPARAAGRATGIVFEEASSPALVSAVSRLVNLYRTPSSWARVQQAAMEQDYTWTGPARRYLALYEELASAR
jgi:starch synthase